MSLREVGSPRTSTAVPVAGVAAVAASATVAVVVLPFVRFAYRAPALHVMLETASALIALLVGYLIYGRYKQGRRLQDFLLVLTLGTVAVANLALIALPSAIVLGTGTPVSGWAGVVVRLLGNVLLGAAVLTPPSLRLGRAQARLLVLGLVGSALAAALVGRALDDRLPPPVDPSVQLGSATSALPAGHPVVLGAHALAVLIYAVAAVSFARQSARTGDELFRWVATGYVLAAFAAVHYLLFPSLYSAYVYTGDVLRLSFYVFLLIGAAREIRTLWELRTRTAVLEDRRRMARDLHDGLAQELSFISAQSRLLASDPVDPVLAERIGGAAVRALDEARRAIAALSRPVAEPLAETLHHLAEDLSRRHDVNVVADVDPRVTLSGQQIDDLLRIVTEAVRNAIRHGGATRIELVLTESPLLLTVTDGGRGFTPSPPDRSGRAAGFGLISMRERAAQLGAELSIMSSPGAGTTVRVAWL